MAIDTRDKRASAAGVALPFNWQPPLPDGTITGSDKYGFAYRGITVAAPNASLDGDQATQLGVTGTNIVFFPDDVAVRAASTDLRDCFVYEALIVTRNEYLITISAVNDLDIQIDFPADMEIMIRTRNEHSIPITTVNDYETNLGC